MFLLCEHDEVQIPKVISNIMNVEEFEIASLVPADLMSCYYALIVVKKKSV